MQKRKTSYKMTLKGKIIVTGGLPMDIVHQLTEETNIKISEFIMLFLDRVSAGEHQHTEMFSLLKDFIEQIGLDLYESLLRFLDDTLYKEVKTLNTHYVQEKGRTRNIITSIGEIPITRRYYKNLRTGTYEYLLDALIALPKNKRIDASCAARIVENALDHSYATAAKMSTPTPISRQTVYNIIKELPKAPIKQDNNEELVEPPNTLYIEADEDHIAIQANNKVNSKSKELKLGVIYEDKKAVCVGKRKLVNKVVFTGFESSTKFWENIQNYIESNYIHYPKEIVIIGDGARWIQAASDYLDNTTFALDYHHFNKYSMMLMGKKGKNSIVSLLENNDIEGFKELCKKVRTANPERIKQIKMARKYIINHWDAIRKTLLRDDISSSSEAQVSHILSRRLSTIARSWSKKNAETIGKLRAYKVNGGDVHKWYINLNHDIAKPTKQLKQIIPNVRKTSDLAISSYCTILPEQHKIPGSCKSGNWSGPLLRLLNNVYTF